jgi:uncharacterized repeat protein (TIGR02543 family)
VRTGYTFAGWNTQADGTGTTYAAGGTFTINENTTLYAKWVTGEKDDPIPLTPPADSLTTGGGWAGLMAGIQSAGKYVALDLSACAMTGTEFDAAPGESDAGESFIVSLILPDAATSIKQGDYIDGWKGHFRRFTNLANMRGDNITTIEQYAFAYCTSLTTVSFPEAISIGYWAFANTGAGALTISLPQNAPSIGETENEWSETYIKTVTIRTPAGRIGYDDAWQTED